VPEIPEVRAHAERLTEEFGGAVLSKFVPISFTALKTYAPAPDVAYGAPLQEVRQRGKYLALVFEPATFVVHLMQGGRLKPDEKQSPKPKGGLARWVFDDGRALLLSEAGTEKRAGVWVVESLTEGEEPIAHLGPDADTLDAVGLAERIGGESKRLHGVLRDQHPMAGIGRRLANEITHKAKLSPFANASKLTEEELERLHAAIQEAVAEGLAYERTRDDMSSSKERPGAVHHRKGEACPVCGDTVREVAYVKYTVNYCPTCQTGGKVLADNTTSKFLK
jgi:formamidopyrimidine-DNA glycosylase